MILVCAYTDMVNADANSATAAQLNAVSQIVPRLRSSENDERRYAIGALSVLASHSTLYLLYRTWNVVLFVSLL